MPHTGEEWMFYLLGGGAVLSSAAMLLPPMGRSPIHSAISLIVSFFFLAGLYALLSAHMLSVLQIIVYAGAVMVLFTFVIMLLNLAPDEMKEAHITPGRIAAGILALFIFGKLMTAIQLTTAGMQAVDLSDPMYAKFGSVPEVGRMMYTTFLVPFELISVLLLVAAVGAVVLAKRSLKYIDRPQMTPAAHEHDAPYAHDDGHDAAGHDNSHGHASSDGHHGGH
jgi:NADH-quinone oxidoreductase subunit J